MLDFAIGFAFVAAAIVILSMGLHFAHKFLVRMFSE